MSDKKVICCVLPYQSHEHKDVIIAALKDMIEKLNITVKWVRIVDWGNDDAVVYI